MKRIITIAAMIAAVLIVIVSVLPLFISADDFKPRLEAELTQALGREVGVGSLKFSVFSGGVTASDLSIADDPAYQRGAFVTAKSLNVKVDLLPLIFSHRLTATGITIDQPAIALIQAPSGEWNFSKLGAKDPPNVQSAAPSGNAGLNFSISLLKVSGGRVTVAKLAPTGPPVVIGNVNGELRDFSITSTMPFSLSANFTNGGELKVQGMAGPLHAGDITLTPGQAKVNVSHLDLALAGVVGNATGIGGLISLDGNATSNGQTADLTGTIKAENLKLVKGGSPAKKPVAFDFILTHDLKTRSGMLTRGDIHIGSAAATVTGTYIPQGAATVINATLAGSKMPVGELEAMLPALNIVLPSGSSLQGGTAQIHLVVAGPSDELIATGSVGLSRTTLKGFDIGAKLSTIEKLAGLKGGANTEIETLSANVKASQSGGETLDHIELLAPSIGQLTGAGTISPSNALDFRLSAMVHGGGVLAVASKTAIPVAVKGTASNPVFVPDVKALANQEVKSLTGIGQKGAGSVLGGIFGSKKNK